MSLFINATVLGMIKYIVFVSNDIEVLPMSLFFSFQSLSSYISSYLNIRKTTTDIIIYCKRYMRWPRIPHKNNLGHLSFFRQLDKS